MKILSGAFFIMVLVIFFGMFIYTALSGIMWMIRPTEWADSRWSLCPPQYREDLNRPGMRMRARISGLFLVGLGTLVPLQIISKLSGAVGVQSPIDIATLAAVLAWLVRYGTMTMLGISGTAALVLPHRLVASKWAMVPTFRAYQAATGKELTVLVRIEGIVFLALAYLIYNPPG